jgi:hypothetical protein
MEIPCPVWPQRPWSPLGYQVVEVTDENIPVTEAAPQSSRPAQKRETSQPPEGPWALPGYRVVEVPVVEVAEDSSPGLARRASPTASAAKSSPPRKLRPLARWGAVAVGGLFLVASVLALVSLQLVTSGRAVPETVLPAGEDGLLGGAGCAAKDGRSVDRENFGTAVGFVRHPPEAARIAAQEQKLTFLLHVSGSFDDAGFT